MTVHFLLLKASQLPGSLPRGWGEEQMASGKCLGQLLPLAGGFDVP